VPVPAGGPSADDQSVEAIHRGDGRIGDHDHESYEFQLSKSGDERSHRATFDLTKPWPFSEQDAADIAQDVLIIHGREDRFVSFAAANWFFERIPNVRLYGIGKCGHWTQIEQHDRFVAVVRGFLAGNL
jgi:2-hydroxymuconate-semialdehyde hydrolase